MVKKTELYKLKPMQHFRAVELPTLGELVYSGRIDGTMAQVTAVDEAINRQQCALYDKHATFFCLRAWTEVEVE